MTKTYTTEQGEQIETIIKAAGKRSAQETAFVRAFFAHAPLADIQLLDAKESYAIAADAYSFAAMRKGNDPIITISSHKKSGVTIRVMGDDMPFLVDSLSMLMLRLGIRIELTLHPIFAVARDSKGKLKTIAAADESHDVAHESLIVMLARGLPDGMDTAALEAHIRTVLRKVRAAVSDWKRMSKEALALAEPFETRLPGIPHSEAWEIGDFLRWLADKNFVFLGLGEFTYAREDDSEHLSLNKKSALGLYTLPPEDSVRDGVIPIEYRLAPATSRFIEITKSSEPCEVHRAVPMDMIAVKRFNSKGAVIGETRILGLFTSNVYYQTTDAIPIIRRKVARVLERSSFDPISHNGKSLKAILEFLPRDELFQLTEDALFALGMGILSLESRPKVRLFTRIDAFERYASCIVYVPRERFSTTVREQIERVLARAYHGNVITFYTQVSDSPLARVNILIATVPGAVPDPDTDALENEITELTNIWADALRSAAIAEFGAAEGESVTLAYSNAFDSAYITAHTGMAAIADIRRIREAISTDGLALELFTRPLASGDIHLKCYTTDTASTLSDVVPMLENMGTKLVEVHPYLVRPKDAAPVLIRDFVLRLPAGHSFDIAANKARLEAAIGNIWRDAFADDALNGLLFKTSLTARDIDILRVFCRYMRQINFPYGQMVIWRTLNTHASLAEALITYFSARFNPTTKKRDAAMEAAKQHIVSALEQVSNLTEDRIIRRILELMECAMRTNAYQTDNAGAFKPYISIKFLSRRIPELPLPKPYAEIFVYSMQSEGIHLRGDTVARGGLRWSDRHEDFRTEVLGLMKAQMVKNAVIVPSGSKGGFVVKQPPEDRNQLQEEAIRCYKQFLSGLLDITDNIVASALTPPQGVVRHDNDDPYLVVAADKGTATFSDIANSVSAAYGFWLGDAFASGGSAGYDHKAMAITARGAWISVERHFREMGRDISKETFTAVGIGDMSGDVFGNGMLLSSTMQLIAAFNHKHIFLDPTPDAKTSFAERKRLFALARSGWNDYDLKKISKGGGVFERSVKSIALSKEVQSALATDVKSASPDELIQLILKAPVHLLWNGGIGTYVKASDESHDDVGDRTNNAVRVNGCDLRCNIIGEGGNLGLTQRGRIEYARTWNGDVAMWGGQNGGRINTDAIDNSAGVDCSDHEVNIKIALGRAVEDGRLTLARRNALLKSMEEDVAHLVLEDNRLQTLAVTAAESQSLALPDAIERMMQDLERQGFLNREVEFLPSSKRMQEIKAHRLVITRPEFAVLLAYSKLALTRDLKSTTRLDDAYFTPDLISYFPEAMQKKYAADITTHRLRREIIATVLTNQIINRTGILFVHRLMVETGASAQTIADAFVFVRDAYGINALWHALDAFDAKGADARLVLELLSTIALFMESRVRHAVQHMPQPIALATATAAHKASIENLRSTWKTIATPDSATAIQRKTEGYISYGLSRAFAENMAVLDFLTDADAIIAASGKKHALAKVASIYHAIGNALDLGNIQHRIALIQPATDTQRDVVAKAQADITRIRQSLLSHILATYGAKPDALTLWMHAHDDAFKRYQRSLATVDTAEFDFATLYLTMRELELLAG